MEVFTAWNLLDARSVLLGLLVFLGLFRILRRPRNLPPGPIGWPIIGNLPQLMTSGGEMHETISKLTARYGNVISLKIPGVSVIVLHGYSVVKEAFAQHQLSARPLLHISDMMRPKGKGIAESSGVQWVEIRRFTMTVLRGLGVGKSSFEQNISTEAEILIKELKKHDGKAFDPKHLIGNTVSNVICSVVLGKRFQYTDLAFQRLLKVLSAYFEQAGAGGLFEISPIFAKLRMLPFMRRYMDAVKNFYNQISLLLKEHDHDQDADNPRDLIDIFLNEKKRKEQQGVESGVESLALQTDNLLHIVSDLFGAGSETTTTTLRWGIVYMMAYPKIQTRVHKELDDVTGRNRFPRISDKAELPYTEAVLCEIQRMGTIVPLAVPHLCSEHTTLLGFNIPKGTLVISNIWHNHFDPSVWEEPLKFRPERFLQEDGTFRRRVELTPFGIDRALYLELFADCDERRISWSKISGRRVCPGEHLAEMELFIFFTQLLHHFTFKKPEDAPPVSFKGVYGFVWAPVKFTVCATARD